MFNLLIKCVMKCYPEIMYKRVVEEMSDLKDAYNSRHIGNIKLCINSLQMRLKDLECEINELLDKYDTEPNNLVVPEHELFTPTK